MWFGGRELTEYSVGVLPDHLVVDELYYAVRFLDAELKTPWITTLVFLGRQEAGSEDMRFKSADQFLETDDFVFVEFDSLRVGEAVSWNGSEPVLAMGVEELSGVFCFEEALNTLLRCSVRRAGDLQA